MNYESESALPSRFGGGRVDDTAQFWGQVYVEGGVLKANVYKTPPDDFGVPTSPPLYTAAAIAAANTFRGFLVTGFWYQLRRPGVEGPRRYIDGAITSWQALGEGTHFGIPAVTGLTTDVALSYDGASFFGSAPWTTAASFTGERVAGGSRGGVDGARTLGAFVRQCPDGSEQ